jgi:hypothetical protein
VESISIERKLKDSAIFNDRHLPYGRKECG